MTPVPAPDRAWLHPYSIVLASAGTGKTYTLSARYLRLLLEPGEDAARADGATIHDPSTILATTFTRKAAGEILDRVLRRLVEAGSDAQALAGLARDTESPLTSRRCRAAAAALARRMDRVRIMTIDAMMQRLARAAALDLGVPPGWSIGSEGDAARLQAEAIDEAIAQDEPALTWTLIRGSARRPFSSRVHRALERAIEDTYAAFLAAGADARAWEAISPTTPALSATALPDAIARLESATLPTTRGGTPVTNYVKARVAIAAAARAADWDAIAQHTLVGALARGGTYSRAEIPQGMRDALEPLVAHAAHRLVSRVGERNRALAALLDRFHRARARAMARTGLLGFDDVPRLLVEAKVGGRLDELWYRMDAAIHHMLIDEAQDTSLIQYRLIEPILDELLSGRAGRSALIVGDVKQSLYAWRQAEAELLPAIADRWPILRRFTLALSQRSSRVVLDAVNSVFSTLASSPALAPDGDDRAGAHEAAHRFQSLFEAHDAAPRAGGPDGPGLVRLRTLPRLDDHAARPRADLIGGVVAAVESLLDEARETGPQPPPEIGVLVRRNKFVRPIVSALRARGLPASEEGGAPLADDPGVAAVLSLLHLADHPSDSLARFHVATSAVGRALRWDTSTSPARTSARAARLRRSLAVHGYATVLERLVERAAPLLPPSSLDHLARMLDLAREFDARSALRPAEFIRMVCERRIARPGGEPIRVMTIHGAKGLEFDAVVLPDLDRAWSPGATGALTLRDSPLGRVEAASIAPPAHVRALHPTLARMGVQRESRQVFEELCALYVAMTRAKRALVMLVAPATSADAPPPLSAAGVLRAALAPERPADEADRTLHESTRPGRHWWAHPGGHPAPLPAPAPAQEADLRLAPPRAGSLRRARVVSPSSLEGGGIVDLGASLDPDAGGGARIGSLVHAMLETIAWLDEGAPDRGALRAACAAFPECPAPDIEAGAAIVDRALAGACGRCLHRTWHETHPTWTRGADLQRRTEWRFLHQDQDASRLVSGAIDRLVLIARDGRVIGADLIDFKTDRVDEQSLAERVEHYRPQLAAYASSVARLFALPPRAIRATLLFLGPDRAVTL